MSTSPRQPNQLFYSISLYNVVVSFYIYISRGQIFRPQKDDASTSCMMMTLQSVSSVIYFSFSAHGTV